MIFNIIAKEILTLIKTMKVVITVIVIFSLFIINAVVSVKNYKEQVLNRDEINIKTSQSLEENSDQLVNLVYVKQQLIKDVPQYLFLSEASEDVIPNGLELTYFTKSLPQYYKFQNPFYNTYSAIDWSFIILFVVSFFCIVLSYDAFSGEKENGTLKLMLSNSISHWKIIIGKFGGIFSIITLSVLAGVLINLIIINISSTIPMNASDIPVIALFLLGSILFIAFNILITFWVSCITKKSSVSLTIILTIWIVLNIVFPNIAWLFAEQFHPVPSFSQVTEKEKYETEQIYKEKNYSTEMNSSWIGRAPNESLLSRVKGINEKVKIHNYLWEDYYNQMVEQTNIAINLCKLSPSSVYRFFNEALSYNGYYGYLLFHEQALVYQSTYQQFINMKDNQDNQSFHLIWQEHKSFVKHFMSSKPVDFNSIPRFENHHPSIMFKLANYNMSNLAILFLWTFICFIGTFISFNKYDIR
ncbi:MAG: ABC transporter permease [Bacteroidales bacterium]|jgi:ABC-type transport system involved in multi-copper enzyme maturation permease subunit|nr:ABC transporter permease [Bacteroidales bacterium]